LANFMRFSRKWLKRARAMGRAARTLFAFAVYVSAVAALLIFVPDTFLGWFGFPPTHEVWIRIVGMCFGGLAFYYVFGSLEDLRPFIRLTVFARSLTLPFFAVLVGLGLTKPVLLLFGVIDLAGALWTAWALRRA